MKSKWMTLTLLCSLLLNLFFILGYFIGQSNSGYKDIKIRQQKNIAEVVSTLKLTETQQNMLAKIMESRQENRKATREELKSKRQALINSLTEDKADQVAVENAIKAINEFYYQKQLNNVKAFLSFKDTLTDEQKQQLEKLMNDPEKRRRLVFPGLL